MGYWYVEIVVTTSVTECVSTSRKKILVNHTHCYYLSHVFMVAFCKGSRCFNQFFSYL